MVCDGLLGCEGFSRLIRGLKRFLFEGVELSVGVELWLGCWDGEAGGCGSC